MIDKNGFLLIELMISFTLAFFLIFIVSHYTIEIKKTQQEALARINLLSIARNSAEKIIAFKGAKGLLMLNYEGYMINMIKKQFSINNDYESDKKTVKFFIKHILAERKCNNKSISLSFYLPHFR